MAYQAPLASTSAVSWTTASLSLPALDATDLGAFKRALWAGLRVALADTSKTPRDAVHQLWQTLPSLDESLVEGRSLLTSSALEALVVEQANGSQELLERAFDVVLAHDERGLCPDTAFFNAYELVLEGQSVSRAEQTFSYLEKRSSQVLKNMDPLRGKGPILLRACNELRRRLSKVTHLDLYGRIGLLLAASFASGDRSSVNLRGEYNTDNVTIFEPPPRPATPPPPAEPEVIDVEEAQAEQSAVMDVDAQPEQPEEGEAEQTKAAPEPSVLPPEDFYSMFWSLQRFFNQPPSLFGSDIPSDVYISAPDTVKASTPCMKALRYGTEKVLEAFSLATKRERAVAGAEAKGKGTTAKVHSAEAVKSEYFFPKYLTSRTLLDLEITDVQFRRQILVQMLVLFQFLLGLTPTERDKLQQTALRVTNKTVLNSSIRPNMVLTEEDAKWISETTTKCRIELRQTPPDGDTVTKTVQLVLEREQNWVLWKICTGCKSFEQGRADAALFADAKTAEENMQKPFKPYEYAVGTAALSSLWKVDVSLDNFQKQSVTSFRQYHDNVKALDVEIAERKAELVKQGKVMPAQQAEDDLLQILIARKNSANWRGLRRILADQTSMAPTLTGQPTLENVAYCMDVQAKKRQAKKERAAKPPSPMPSDNLPTVSLTDGVAANGTEEAETAKDAALMPPEPAMVAVPPALEEGGPPQRADSEAETNDEEESMEVSSSSSSEYSPPPGGDDDSVIKRARDDEDIDMETDEPSPKRQRSEGAEELPQISTSTV